MPRGGDDKPKLHKGDKFVIVDDKPILTIAETACLVVLVILIAGTIAWALL
jgi:hypothetical protein